MEKMFLIEDKYTNNIYYLTGVSNVSGSRRTTITNYTTPSGRKISDNAFVEPQTVSFTINTSHLAMTPQKIIRGNSPQLSELTVQEIKDTIYEWQTKAIKLNITTFEGYYTNMVISEVSTTEGDELGVWKPSITFKEVREATAEFVELDFPKDSEEKANGNEEQPLGADNGVSAGDVGSVLGGAAAGALAGAAIGSLFPGPGTAIGAAIGAVVGFFVGVF